MRSAPRFIAWSRKALNLISALHSTSGLGVRPARYSLRNSLNTRSLYSALKLTASISMPMRSATATASTRSWREVQCSSVSSSSQFFMNRPVTSCPCCLSSSAATDESTPPDMPTTIFCLRAMVLEIVVQQVQRVALTRKVIVDAGQQQMAALPRVAGADFRDRHPQRAHDAGVEFPSGFAFRQAAGERKPQVRHAAALLMILVYADQRGRGEAAGGFLQRLP